MSREKSVRMNETARENHMFLKSCEDIEKSKNIDNLKKVRQLKNRSKLL